MLRAVLFDLDNTLVDRDRAFRECVEAQFPDPTLRAELCRLDAGGRGERDPLFQAWMRYTAAPMNQELFGRLLAERIQPNPALQAELLALAKTVKLGVISNGSGETQRRKLRAAGLREVFAPDRIWISGEVGWTKPDARIFLLAVWALGETREHCLYVGDHEQDDLCGARNAGLRACRAAQPLDAERLRALLKQQGIA